VIFHRIVKTSAPTAQDFTPVVARGLAVRLPPELERFQSGLSAYRTLRQAAAKARRYPSLGSYIAVLDVPHRTTIHTERTTQQRGHYTVWGDAGNLLSCVVAVVPVSEIR